MKLYGSLTSPYVRKARILLQEKNIPCEFVVEDPWDPNSLITKLNPLGKVPALQLDNQRVLFDSPVILEYLDSLFGEPLIPAKGDTRWQVLRWQALADGILDAVVARLWESRRPVEQQSEDMIARQEQKVARVLAHAENTIHRHPHLVADKFTMADLALAVALEYIDFRYQHDWRSRAPRLAFWLEGISRRPSFPETVPPGMTPRQDAPN